MTITRVQQVSAVLTGTSDTVALPLAPTYGNTLIAVLARAEAAPIATSLTQPNVTWSNVASGSNSDEVGHQLFIAQNVGPGAGDTITVTRTDSDDYAIIVFEYAGLLTVGTPTDQTATASQDGQSPYTGLTSTTTQADELFLAAFAHTYLVRLLDDNLNADAGYWRADTSITSSIAFAAGVATVAGLMYPEPTGSATWSNYRVAADVSGTSPLAGGNGWFGIAAYSSGEYLTATGNGYGGLINTLDNNVYSVEAVNGVLSINTYPYGGFGTLNPGQVYRLELRARTTTAGDVVLSFYVDGTQIFSEVHSGAATSGTPGLAVSAATPQTATFNNLLVRGLDDTRVEQTGPSNGFAELVQSTDAEQDDSRVVLGIFEKVVDAIGTPNVAVQTSESVVWSSRLQTFFADPSTEASLSATLNTYVADLFELTLPLDVLAATTSTLTLPLNFVIQPILEADLQVFIGGTAVFSQLDVSLDTSLDRRALLNVIITATELKTADLAVVVALGVFERAADLEVHVGTTSGGPSKNPVRIAADLDVAVLVRQPTNTSSTTPEGSDYLACRELWCNVPRPRRVTSRYDVNVGGEGLLTAQLHMHIQDGFTRLATLQVFIAPEP